MRVLTDNGTMYFMTATQHMPYLDVYVSEKYNVLCRIVWTYDSSGVQSKKMFGSLYEPILMINKNAKAKYTFNHQDILVEAKTGAKRNEKDHNAGGDSDSFRAVFVFPAECGQSLYRSQERQNHY